MAKIDVEIAARRYSLACRDGEEDHLRSVAAVVDRKARDAAQSLGPMNESRQLLFASLMLADELRDAQAGIAPPPPPPPPPAPPAPVADPMVAEALERLADRIESLAASLESKGNAH